MKLWGGDSDTGCCSVADVDDARRVAQQLGIDHLVFNFGDDFDEPRRRALRRRPRRRAHAEPVHRVQPPPQVRPAAAPGRRCSASTRSPPATTPGSWTGRRRPRASAVAPTGPRTRATCVHMLDQAALARVRFPVGDADQGRGARPRPPRSGCAPRPSPTARTSASSPRAAGAPAFLGGRHPAPRRPSWSTRRARTVGAVDARRAGHGRPAPRPRRPAVAASGGTSSTSTGRPRVVTVGLAGRPAGRRSLALDGLALGRRPGRRATCSPSAAPTASPQPGDGRRGTAW